MSWKVVLAIVLVVVLLLIGGLWMAGDNLAKETGATDVSAVEKIKLGAVGSTCLLCLKLSAAAVKK